jgi:hypothetical protein
MVMKMLVNKECSELDKSEEDFWVPEIGEIYTFFDRKVKYIGTRTLSNGIKQFEIEYLDDPKRDRKGDRKWCGDGQLNHRIGEIYTFFDRKVKYIGTRTLSNGIKQFEIEYLDDPKREENHPHCRKGDREWNGDWQLSRFAGKIVGEIYDFFDRKVKCTGTRTFLNGIKQFEIEYLDEPKSGRKGDREWNGDWQLSRLARYGEQKKGETSSISDYKNEQMEEDCGFSTENWIILALIIIFMILICICYLIK